MDVIKFSQSKALECSRDNDLLDRDSARLLWDFIMLLCRQNGVRHQKYARHKHILPRLLIAPVRRPEIAYEAA